jgi:hypothetical protein
MFEIQQSRKLLNYAVFHSLILFLIAYVFYTYIAGLSWYGFAPIIQIVNVAALSKNVTYSNLIFDLTTTPPLLSILRKLTIHSGINANVATATVPGSLSATRITLGITNNWGDSDRSVLGGQMQEAVFWPSDKSIQVAAIRQNVNQFLSVY